ncbi:hypothetical protein RFN25_25090 [Mesorhizobium abyssinicae]|nr:hypothetical protein [Mesorhizobium abyssinicae]MDX8436704.1 hypothetical protein [Mesorhizobium abyssinicae]
MGRRTVATVGLGWLLAGGCRQHTGALYASLGFKRQLYRYHYRRKSIVA